MDGTTQVFAALFITLAIVISMTSAQYVFRRKTPPALRDITAYTTLPRTIGAAIEANRPLHLSYGGAGIGGASTLLALASSELFYHAARAAAIGDAQPVLTASDTTALPLALDTLRRAYRSRDLVARLQGGTVHWYPAGTRSLAFAAALTGVLGDDRVSTSVLVGSFGAELALIADAAARRGQGILAASDQLDGQAVAFAFADAPLIGEELFRSGAYLDEDNRAEVASAFAADVLRFLVVLTLAVLTILNIPDVANAVGGLLAGLRGGG